VLTNGVTEGRWRRMALLGIGSIVLGLAVFGSLPAGEGAIVLTDLVRSPAGISLEMTGLTEEATLEIGRLPERVLAPIPTGGRPCRICLMAGQRRPAKITRPVARSDVCGESEVARATVHARSVRWTGVTCGRPALSGGECGR
jgi:hypothetical protein